MYLFLALKTRVAGWIGAAMILLLATSSAPLQAQREGEHDKKEAPAAQSAPARQERQARQERSQPAARQERSQPAARQERSQPAARQDTTAQPGRQRPAQNNQTPAQNNRQTPAQNTQPRNTDGGRRFGQSGQPPNNQPGNTDGGRRFGQSGQPQQGGRFGGQGQSVRTRNGGMVNRDMSGRVREVRTPGGASIYHRPDGMRRVEMVRPGNRVIVTYGGGRSGYIQRPLVYRNHSYVQRTYYVHGTAYARVYRPMSYRGAVFNVYSPARYYRPSFYAWAYNPWSRPIAYGWGWSGRPWYGYYGGYFSPYPTYVSPAFWLTDYLIANTLERAYEERMDASIANAAVAGTSSYGGGQPGLSPDVKDAIAEEVRRQINQEGAEGQTMDSNSSMNPASDVPPLFADNRRHIFVVSGSLEVTSGGQDCTVSEGDVLQLNGAPPPDAIAANVIVLASKSQDCRKGSVVSVSLEDLQEMQNRMRETIDQGLADLQSRQGQGGLPALPASAAGPAVAAPYAAGVQPDTNVAAELGQAAQEADRGEQDTVNQSQDLQGGGAAPATITLGQTMDQVAAIQGGPPQKVVDLGAKKIYVYRDIKITFTDGRVTDVQ